MVKLRRAFLDFQLHVIDKAVIAQKLAEAMAINHQESLVPFVENIGDRVGNIEHSQHLPSHLEDRNTYQGTDFPVGRRFEM
jgi:hypothetical protein